MKISTVKSVSYDIANYLIIFCIIKKRISGIWVTPYTLSWWGLYRYICSLVQMYCGSQHSGWPPNDAHIPLPETCEYVALHRNRSVAVVIKLRVLKWGNDPGLSIWDLTGSRKKGWRQRLENATLLALKLPAVALSQGMQAASRR